MLKRMLALLSPNGGGDSGGAGMLNVSHLFAYSNWDRTAIAMPRRRAITDAQLEALLALPTAEPDLIRHYTLSPADLAVIARPAGLAAYAAQGLARKKEAERAVLKRPGRSPRFPLREVSLGSFGYRRQKSRAPWTDYSGEVVFWRNAHLFFPMLCQILSVDEVLI